MESTFEWDMAKDAANQQNHGVSFADAQHAFLDKNRVIAKDVCHSQKEQRYYCVGLNREGTGILTVRFTYRRGRVRIIEAGYWRRGKRIYEQANAVQ